MTDAKQHPYSVSERLKVFSHFIVSRANPACLWGTQAGLFLPSKP
jgi:hypothetical protein